MGIWYCEEEEREGKRKTVVRKIPLNLLNLLNHLNPLNPSNPCWKQDKNQDKPLDEDGGRCPAAQSSALVL